MANIVLRTSRLISPIFKNNTKVFSGGIKLSLPSANFTTTQHLPSSYRSSNPVRDINEYPEVEIIYNPPEWKYVEKVLRQKYVPKPQPKDEYPSGWTPPTKIDENIKYYVARTKNHMIPVYLQKKYRGERLLTYIRRIEGDIWCLEKELRIIVEKARNGKTCASRVNEMSGQIVFHGDYVNVIKDYLIEKGF